MSPEDTLEEQQYEITALQSIYGSHFRQPPPPKAWKGAQRLPEFILKVPPPDSGLSDNIWFDLHVKFPKTYPTLACPIFTIQQHAGLTINDVHRLTSLIHDEAQKYKGTVMVFEVATLATDWIRDHVKPPIETGSLAAEMTKRAQEEEKARREREAEQQRMKERDRIREGEELYREIEAEVEQRQRNRNRADSAVTAVPFIDGDDSDIDPGEIERFDSEIDVDGLRFDKVRLVRPRKGEFMTVYVADPICDTQPVNFALEAHVVTFHSPYYLQHQGRKKLKGIESELMKLTTLRHTNLISIYAVKMSFVGTYGRLFILAEEFPSLTLADALFDYDKMREEKVSEYLTQILGALNVVHAADIVHRGINCHAIGLATREIKASSSPIDSSKTIASLSRPPPRSREVKVGRVGYYTRLAELNRSNPFALKSVEDMKLKMEHFPPAMFNEGDQSTDVIPDSWNSRDAIESPFSYTRYRDFHALGIVLLKMLLGDDVTARYDNGTEALRAADISQALYQQAATLLSCGNINKKGHSHVSCLSLLAQLAEPSFRPIKRSPVIPYQGSVMGDPKTPTAAGHYIGSPPSDTDYFRPARPRQSSRWKEDWESLERLGKGGFGNVFKARNKVDNVMYAVKRIRLKGDKRQDHKIFREVTALSQLNHRFIVRYYGTWIETSEDDPEDPGSTAASDDEFSEGSAMMTSVPRQSSGFSGNGVSFDLSDLDSGSGTGASFPSIHFSNGDGDDSESESEGEADGDEDADENGRNGLPGGHLIEFEPEPPRRTTTMMYIQMEFVERQTLKERIAQGISEDEAWRLFQQILDALVYMNSRSILHRDIKCTNIFIDAKGDCKVGDFGLATSSVPSDSLSLSPRAYNPFNPMGDWTMEVGTRLYIAPEVLSRKKGARNHSKADIYSLGIVFFEMNYPCTTTAERIAVLEEVRKPTIIFPTTWDKKRSRQRQIITMMLQHDPDDRPTANEIAQSPLIPSRIEEEYFRAALRTMVKPDTVHHQAVLSALFTEPPQRARAYAYDSGATHHPEHAGSYVTIHEHITAIFRLHGAVDMEPALLMPLICTDDEKSHATFIDRHGDLVVLPKDNITPFARLAAREGYRRIKRYHLSNTYRPNDAPGNPKVTKVGIFDIIAPDTETNAVTSGAEILMMMSELMQSFPNLSDNYEIHVSHSIIVDLSFQHVPPEIHPIIQDIVNQTKPSSSQKRNLLTKDAETLASAILLTPPTTKSDERWLDGIEALMQKTSLSTKEDQPVKLAIETIKDTLKHARYAGFNRAIHFTPLMFGNFHTQFKNGVLLAVVRKNKRGEILAIGGRYDHLITRFSTPLQRNEGICALALQVFVEKIVNAVKEHDRSYAIKEPRSFGYWTSKRCSVYVVSHHQGFLQDRLEVVADLWNHGVSADLMYESGVTDVDAEDHLEACAREGILFTVWPKPRRDTVSYKIKSILSHTEYEVTRQELVPWLQQRIAEQKRIDETTSGAATSSLPVLARPKDKSGPSELIQLVLPTDVKKQRKHAKQMFSEKAYETAESLKTAFQTGVPTLAIEAPPSAFDLMTRNSAWITEDELWKPILAEFWTQHSYAASIREAVAKKKEDGIPYLLLFSVKDERTQLLSL